jgi:DNA-directed RNA polymerase II subunit RPB11
MTNAQERFELLDDENTIKVSFEKDTKIPNAVTFTIRKEDHTLGNLLRMQLLRDPAVSFAAYKVPHPLEPQIVVKVQTKENKDPVITTTTALTALENEFAEMRAKLEEQLQRHRQ